jgi:dipeptidyl-peptidase 4
MPSVDPPPVPAHSAVYTFQASQFNFMSGGQLVKRTLQLLLACSLFSGVVAAQSAALHESGKNPLSIESIFAPGGITGREPESIQWSPDHRQVSFVVRDNSGEQGELWSVDAVTGEKKLLVNSDKLALLAPPPGTIKNERERERVTRYHIASYHWAPDSQHLLFDAQGELWLYSLATGTGVQLTSSPDPVSDPKFSPDGKHVAYVGKHNLYVHSVPGRGEKQLTKDESENFLNGEVDWVYTEELNVRSNYFWSPDSKDIAFLRMDETKVPAYPITNWMPTHAKVDMQKYPQPGDSNPAVKLGVISASGGNPKWVSLGDDPDIYIPRFGWVRNGILWAEVLNRDQTQLDLYFVDAGSGKSRKMLTESDPTGWININDDFSILSSEDRFLWSNWRDGHTHLYLYSFDEQDPLASDAKLERQLTHGDFEVLKVDGVDNAAGVVYFTCNKDDPRQQQLYSVKLDGTGLQRVSAEDGWHTVNFDEDGKHYVDLFSALSTPPAFSLCQSGGRCQMVWQSRNIEAYGITPPKFLEFKAADGTTLYGKLLLPPEDAASAKVPLIVYVYGGPAAQVVVNAWPGPSDLFHQRLARLGFAVFSVDNRGTPNRSRKFQVAIRHQFGALELQDQLAALNQVLAQYPQLDRSRIGIWGWSNGGSMTLYAMTHSDVFKAGVAVAPVTNWRDYDSIYTERWLGTPRDNPQGYADPITQEAGKMHGALLLAQGTSDDNVHFQNSIQIIEELVEAGKQFRFMAYPNKTHSIAGSVDRDHLFHMIEDHFERELK